MLFIIQVVFCISLLAGNQASSPVESGESTLQKLNTAAQALQDIGSGEAGFQIEIASIYRQIFRSLQDHRQPVLQPKELQVLTSILSELGRNNWILTSHKEFPIGSRSPQVWAKAFRDKLYSIPGQAGSFLGLSPDSQNQVLEAIGDPKSVMRAQRVSIGWHNSIQRWAYPLGMKDVEMEPEDNQGSDSKGVRKASFQDHYRVAKFLFLTAPSRHRYERWNYFSQMEALTPGSLPERLMGSLKNGGTKTAEFKQVFQNYSSLAKAGNFYAQETLLWLSMCDRDIQLPNESWVTRAKHPAHLTLTHPFYPRPRHYLDYLRSTEVWSQLMFEEEVKAILLRAVRSGYSDSEKMDYWRQLTDPMEKENWLVKWHDQSKTKEDRTNWLVTRAILLMSINKSDQAISLLEEAFHSANYDDPSIYLCLLKFYFMSAPEKLPEFVRGNQQIALHIESSAPTTYLEHYEGDSVEVSMMRESRDHTDDFAIAEYLRINNKYGEALALYERHKAKLLDYDFYHVDYFDTLFQLGLEERAFSEIETLLSKNRISVVFASSVCDLYGSLNGAKDQDRRNQQLREMGAIALSDGKIYLKESVARAFSNAGMKEEAYAAYEKLKFGPYCQIEDIKEWMKLCLDRREAEKALASLHDYKTSFAGGRNPRMRDLELAHLEMDALMQLGRGADARKIATDSFEEFKRVAYLYLEEGEKSLGEETLREMESFLLRVESGLQKDKMTSDLSCLRDEFFHLKGERKVRRNAFVREVSPESNQSKAHHLVTFEKQGHVSRIRSVQEESF